MTNYVIIIVVMLIVAADVVRAARSSLDEAILSGPLHRALTDLRSVHRHEVTWHNMGKMMNGTMGDYHRISLVINGRNEFVQLLSLFWCF